MTRRTVRRLLLALSGILVVAILVTFRHIARPARRPVAEPSGVTAPPGAGTPTVLLSQFDYSEKSAGVERYRIHARRTVGFAPGAGLPQSWYGLEDVLLTIHRDSGPPLEVSASRAAYDPRTRAMRMEGKVDWRDGAVSGSTAKVEFDPRSSRVLVPEPLTFRRGGISGQARSAVYDRGSGHLQLAGPITAGGTVGMPANAVSLVSDSAEIAGDPGSVSLMGHVTARCGSDRIDCPRLDLAFGPDDRLLSARARGGVAGLLSASPGRGGPWRLDAREAQVRFDARAVPTEITAAGEPATLAEIPPGGRSLSARRIRAVLSGGEIRRADASGDVRARAPDPSAPEIPRTLQCDEASVVFGAGNSLRSLRAAGHVVSNSAAGRASGDRAELLEGTPRAVFLSGPTSAAQVETPRGRLLGERIEIDQRRGVTIATGQARAFLAAAASGEGAPAILSGGSGPTLARADRILLRNAPRQAELTGHAALWRGDDVLLADRMYLDDSRRSLNAQGNVRASGKEAGKTPAGSSGIVTIESPRMLYSDQSRQAVFDGGVRMGRDAAQARARTATAKFSAGGGVESVELTGDVAFSDPATGRSGSGDRAVDEETTGTLRLFGAPASARDAAGNRVDAPVLTFHRRSGTVEAESRDGGKIKSVYQTRGHRP